MDYKSKYQFQRKENASLKKELKEKNSQILFLEKSIELIKDSKFDSEKESQKLIEEIETLRIELKQEIEEAKDYKEKYKKVYYETQEMKKKYQNQFSALIKDMRKTNKKI